jgi:sugar diacid utilization regulator
LEPLTANLDRAAVGSVSIAEELGDLGEAPQAAAVLLTPSASAAAGTYRFDMALRLGRSRGVGAVVLFGAQFDRVTLTSATLAEQANIAIVRADPKAALADVAIAIAHQIDGPADVALWRADAALEAMLGQAPTASPATIVDATSRAIGRSIEYLDAPRAGIAVAVRGQGLEEMWLCADADGGHDERALRLILHLLADTIARSLDAAQRADEMPARSRAEVLSELLSAHAPTNAPLLTRARSLGIPIDGWHVAVRVELDESDTEEARDEVAAFEARQAIIRVLMETAQSAGGVWHSAQLGPAMLLLRMYRENPGPSAAGDVAQIASRALERVRSTLPKALMRCGVGSAHHGANGLMSSAAEARAAIAAARASGRSNVAVCFDGVGLRRTLVEWYASDTAREAVKGVLAPLERLGSQKGDALIRTLQAYLDHQGSLSRAAEVLSLHRNAVKYRIDKAFEALELDPDDPDSRLLLQLACRARDIG